MNHQKKLIAVAIGLACSGASADTITNTRAVKSDICGRFEIFHINGITTVPTDASKNLTRISEVYGNAYNGHLLSYALAYNKTRGFFADFKDSAIQVLSGYAGATWAEWKNAVMNGVYTVMMNQPRADDVAKRVDDLFALTKPAPYQDQDLADLLYDINRQTTKTSRKVFIPHSQGNLYMNLVFDKLVAAGTPASSMGVVGVAVPYYAVKTGNTYITSSNDLVIDSTRSAMHLAPNSPAILTPNVTIPYDLFGDEKGHNLIGTYLANSTVRSMLVSRITSEFNGLKTTVKLGSDNTGPSKFKGMAWASDCTGVAPFGDMSKWPNQWPAGRNFFTCGYGIEGGTNHPYFVPMVFYRVAGQFTQLAKPGDPGEVPGLANAHRDGCIAAAKGFYDTWVATGAVDGTFGNCSDYGTGYGSNYKIELATRYRDLISGDGTTTWSVPWVSTVYAESQLNVYKGPTCRN